MNGQTNLPIYALDRDRHCCARVGWSARRRSRGQPLHVRGLVHGRRRLRDRLDSGHLCLRSGHGVLVPNQPVDYRNVSEGSGVFTNPLNGATVIQHFASAFSDIIISGAPEGVHTHELTTKRQPELFRTDHGGVNSFPRRTPRKPTVDLEHIPAWTPGRRSISRRVRQNERRRQMGGPLECGPGPRIPRTLSEHRGLSTVLARTARAPSLGLGR
jgi:hypothetical protein